MTAATGPSCAGRPGIAVGTDTPVALDERLLSALAAFARSRTDVVCPLGDAEVWGELGHQLYLTAGGQKLQLVAGPDTGPVAMPDAAFSAYFVAGGRSGNAAQALMGLPTGERRDSHGSMYSFSSGGLVIGTHEDGPYFYLLKPAADEWNATGGWTGQLGAPTSLVWPWQGTFGQDFELGHLYITPSGSLDLSTVPAGAVRWERSSDSRGRSFARATARLGGSTRAVGVIGSPMVRPGTASAVRRWSHRTTSPATRSTTCPAMRR